MNLFREFCHPTRWYSKLIAACLALAFFIFLAAAIIAGYMVYRMVTPLSAQAALDLTNFPGHPDEITYSTPSDGDRTAWFFPGLTSAPVVVLCPGYQTSRGEALPLAAAIQDHGYNVLVFDIEGAGADRNSALGFRETAELRAALAAVSQRDDVDRSRFGLWGADLGGYVALAVAEGDPRVKAVAAESVYDHPYDMAGVLIGRQGVSSLPLLGSLARKGFYWLHYSERDTPPLSANLDRLAGVAKLFLATSQDAGLAAATQELHARAPEPKDLAVLPHAQYSGLVDQEKRAYENRLLSFLLVNLPLEAPEAGPAMPSSVASAASSGAAAGASATNAPAPKPKLVPAAR